MSYSKTAIVIFIVLLCKSQVKSELRYESREYEFEDQKLIIGKNHIENSTWAYVLCQRRENIAQVAECTINLDSNAFDETKPVKSCPLHLSTRFSNGELKFLGVELWGKDKVIVSWKDVDKDNILQSPHVMIQIVTMQNCLSIVHEIEVEKEVENIHNVKSQIFILLYENSVIVSFLNSTLCGNSVCKMTINQNGEASEPVGWFPNKHLIHTLVPIEGHSNVFLITIGTGERKVKYRVLGENGKKLVGRSTFVDGLGWSTSNGVVSVCGDICLHTDYDGEQKSRLRTKMDDSTQYAALYNLPNGGHLAMICDRRNDFYRLVHIGSNERIKQISQLSVYCKRKPKYLSSKFFGKINEEYCLSILLSAHFEDWYMFQMYCVSHEDLF